ncbi:hypothetical protein HYALB_00002385 [Hymenoscyphus albidus]|uniref:Uncharacterized protein n=1 Tax=Hymenoscyphus albidus TaxID=595503 RepID=A0A9N9LP46_9HELO|nr:hypothetical protein HYALB_00002385 [Hymenoscyphus albidus]
MANPVPVPCAPVLGTALDNVNTPTPPSTANHYNPPKAVAALAALAAILARQKGSQTGASRGSSPGSRALLLLRPPVGSMLCFDCARARWLLQLQTTSAPVHRR